MRYDTTITEKPYWAPLDSHLRCLKPEDRPLHKAMSEAIYEALPNKEWLIPMTDEEYDDTYQKKSRDIVYGIVKGDSLIATSSLLHDVRAYAVNEELSVVLKHKCIEIGESMVLPEYRGNKLMFRLNTLIKEQAQRDGIEYMLATAHPDNIASNSSLKRLGYQLIKEFTRAGKRRNLYLMRL